MLAAVVVIAAAVVYGSFNPATTRFPRCPFFVLTGLKCPGCGSQRALYQLFHLHIAEAFKYNAALVVSIPVLLFLFLGDAFRSRAPRFYRASISTAVSWGLAAAVILWWVVRNIFNW